MYTMEDIEAMERGAKRIDEARAHINRVINTVLGIARQFVPEFHGRKEIEFLVPNGEDFYPGKIIVLGDGSKGWRLVIADDEEDFSRSHISSNASIPMSEVLKIERALPSIVSAIASSHSVISARLQFFMMLGEQEQGDK